MINEFIEPALKRRAWEVVKVCEEQNKEVFAELESVLKKLRRYAPLELIDDLHTVEDLFVRKQTEAVINAHRIGFEDCKELCREIKSFLL